MCPGWVVVNSKGTWVVRPAVILLKNIIQTDRQSTNWVNCGLTLLLTLTSQHILEVLSLMHVGQLLQASEPSPSPAQDRVWTPVCELLWGGSLAFNRLSDGFINPKRAKKRKITSLE
jgi:hypothetical protein